MDTEKHACGVILNLFLKLTPDQKEDVALFQKTFVNRENDARHDGRDTAIYKDDNNWLLYDENLIIGIGKMEKWTPKPDWKREGAIELSSQCWEMIRPFVEKIVSIKKEPSQPFELTLKSGLTLVVAPRII